MAALSYQVKETIYDSKSMLDEMNFYHQDQGKPSELTRTLTYILGDANKNYPLSQMTIGNVGQKTMVELDDVQFTYPIMGRDDKASVISSTTYSGTDKPGVGHQPFDIYFTDNWIKRFYIIESALGVQAYVLSDGEKVGNEYKYKVQLDPADADDYCPLSELQAGVLWSDINAQVPESESTGTQSRMAMPGSWKNQMGFLRCSKEWAGNSSNKTMNITVKTDKGTTNVWMDFEMWQFEKKCAGEWENSYWYSRYNRLASGTVPLKDLLSKKVIPRGSGVYEQIQNKSTFSKLTYAGLQNKIGSALFGMTDSDGLSITLSTGKGGLRDVDGAMKEKGAELLTDFTGVADKFVTGSGRDLMLGGFFIGFYHIDGMVVKVKYNPMNDYGKVAQKSPKHPVTGFPLESHRLTFIDDNDVDGQPNIQHVSQKGRSYLHGIVPGLTPVPRSLTVNGGFNLGGESAQLLASDSDKSSYHRFKSAGIQLLRANRCFDMQCVKGL